MAYARPTPPYLLRHPIPRTSPQILRASIDKLNDTISSSLSECQNVINLLEREPETHLHEVAYQSSIGKIMQYCQLLNDDTGEDPTVASEVAKSIKALLNLPALAGADSSSPQLLRQLKKVEDTAEQSMQFQRSGLGFLKDQQDVIKRFRGAYDNSLRSFNNAFIRPSGWGGYAPPYLKPGQTLESLAKAGDISAIRSLQQDREQKGRITGLKTDFCESLKILVKELSTLQGICIKGAKAFHEQQRIGLLGVYKAAWKTHEGKPPATVTDPLARFTALRHVCRTIDREEKPTGAVEQTGQLVSTFL